MATANASSKAEILGSLLGNKEGKELRENAKYCSLCDSDAEYYCNTCNSYLCNECRGSHKRQRATKTHDVVHISNAAPSRKAQYVFCQMHRGLAIQHYCKKCDVVICATCIKNDHKSHTLLSLSDAKDEIKNMCLEKVKLLQLPLSKMKSEEQLLEKSKDAQDSLTETEKDLSKRGEALISFIKATVLQESEKLQRAKCVMKGSISQMSSELNAEINTCESVLTPVMSVVLKNDALEILRCSQTIEAEIGNATDVLARIGKTNHCTKISIGDNDISQVENEIKKYLCIDDWSQPGLGVDSTLQQKIIKGIQLVNITKVNSFYFLSSRIVPEKFFVQDETGQKILQMSYTGSTDATVRSLGKDLPTSCRNRFGHSVLTLSSNRHVVITDSGLNLCDSNHVIRYAPHTTDGYKPGNLAYVSDNDFITICSEQKKIRYHSTATLDVLGTYDLKVGSQDVTILENFLLLTPPSNILLHTCQDGQNKLIQYSKRGEFTREVSINDEFFKYSMGTVHVINKQLIYLHEHGAVHNFTLQGEHMCIGQIDNDVDFVWGASTDGAHLYVSYQKDYKSRFVAKFRFLYI